MSKSRDQVITDIRQHVGDLSNIIWNSDNVEMVAALKRAVEEAWPWFFTHVADETTYVGAGAVGENVSEIAVPAAFLASGERGPGEIFSIWMRDWDGSSASPVPASWTRLVKSVRRVDPLSAPSPKIKFWNVYSRKCEIAIYGGVPLTMAAAGADPMPGVDTINGYLAFLRHKTAEYLWKSRINSGSYDRENALAQSQLEKQEADAAAWKFRMERPNYTLFGLRQRR